MLFVLVFGFLASRPPAEAAHIIWSPYQKLEVYRDGDKSNTEKYFVSVNNAGYMMLTDLSDESLKSMNHPFGPHARSYIQYDIPYKFQPNPREVLIVGAGGVVTMWRAL